MSPYIKGRGSEYSNVLVLIDNSASMSGIYSGEETKLDVAKEQASDYVSSNDGARYTVLSASNTSDLLISGSSDKGRVKDAINNIEATDIAGSLENATSMVQSLAINNNSAAICMYISILLRNFSQGVDACIFSYASLQRFNADIFWLSTFCFKRYNNIK